MRENSSPTVVTEAMFHRFMRHHNIGWFDSAGKWHSPEEPKAANGTNGANGHGHRHHRGSERDSVVQRARSYLAKIDPGVSGQSGSCPTFRAACELVIGFGLSIADAMPILKEYSERCHPPWNDKELLHKLRSADAKPGQRGWRLAWKDTEPAYDPLPEWVSDEQLEGQKEQDSVDAVAQFPLDAFPPLLQRYAAAVAKSVGCPVDFPACSMLFAAALCLGNTRTLNAKKHWQEVASMYLCIVAEPSMAKSPALKICCDPIYRTQKEWNMEFFRLKDQVMDKQAVWDAWQRKGCKGPAPERPRHITRKDIYTTDSTTEKLALMLRDNPRGLAIIKDELRAWITSMNQYRAGGKGSDRQFFLTAHSRGQIKQDRKNEEHGSICVDYPFLSVLGTIQPDMLGEFRDERGREDGFIHRILFCYPDTIPFGNWNEVNPDSESETAWIEACNYLLSLKMKNDLDGSESDYDTPAFNKAPQHVDFLLEGKTVFVDWFNGHAAEVRSPDLNRGLISPWIKMTNYALRFCLAVHFIRRACGEVAADSIDGPSATFGCMIAEYFKSHARKVYRHLYCDQNDHRADQAVEWIKHHEGRTTSREMVHKNVAGIKTVSQAKRLMEDLEERFMGNISKHKSKNGKELWSFTMGRNVCEVAM